MTWLDDLAPSRALVLTLGAVAIAVIAAQVWFQLQSLRLTGCGKKRWSGRFGRDSLEREWMVRGWRVRGPDRRTEGLFSYTSCERRVPAGHPLRSILTVADAALAALNGHSWQLYAMTSRPSIPPERLLRALLLQAFYSIRSERQLMEQLDYNLLFRWFVGLDVDDPVWDVTVFTQNRDRLLEDEVAAKFLRTVLAQPKVKTLLSDEHFLVDGTLIQAWANMKSFRAKGRSGDLPAPDRNSELDFHGKRTLPY